MDEYMEDGEDGGLDAAVALSLQADFGAATEHAAASRDMVIEARSNTEESGQQGDDEDVMLVGSPIVAATSQAAAGASRSSTGAVIAFFRLAHDLAASPCPRPCLALPWRCPPLLPYSNTFFRITLLLSSGRATWPPDAPTPHLDLQASSRPSPGARRRPRPRLPAAGRGSSPPR